MNRPSRGFYLPLEPPRPSNWVCTEEGNNKPQSKGTRPFHQQRWVHRTSRTASYLACCAPHLHPLLPTATYFLPYGFVLVQIQVHGIRTAYGVRSVRRATYSAACRVTYSPLGVSYSINFTWNRQEVLWAAVKGQKQGHVYLPGRGLGFQCLLGWFSAVVLLILYQFGKERKRSPQRPHHKRFHLGTHAHLVLARCCTVFAVSNGACCGVLRFAVP